MPENRPDGLTVTGTAYCSRCLKIMLSMTTLTQLTYTGTWNIRTKLRAIKTLSHIVEHFICELVKA